jgi:hypothetical protein
LKIQHYMHPQSKFLPGMVWSKLRKRAWQIINRILIRIPGSTIARLNRRSLVTGISDKDTLLKRIKQGPFPVFFIDDQYKEKIGEQFQELFPGEKKNIIQAANIACQHVFNLLGSGQCALGKDIDWQEDFISGHHWDEKTFYLDLHPAPYPGGYDIKVPWELSRSQHFVWLGQAYWLTGDEKYAREFCSQVEQWISRNPPQMGVNWVCAMDVGIRAVNWLWGYAFFRHSPILSDSFHKLFYQSMLEHGRHIMHNLEDSEVLTSNHYISDLVGLVYLGFLLPELKEAQTWRNFGLRELESEIMKQVYPDGVDFEASTNYHRLATELFLSATMLAQKNGFTFSPEYLTRLERMIEAIGILIRPDGTTPIIGDQDNGRLHRLKVWENPSQEWINFRPIYAVGVVWFEKRVGMQFSESDYVDAFWFAGPDAVRTFQRINRAAAPAPANSVLLPDGGWAVLRDRDDYLMIDVGQVGQNGQGGHSHNDSLSVDVFANGQSWIVDPGTFVYTSDYASRHSFRVTRAHNTVYFPGHEQSQIDEKNIFRVESPSKTRVIRWETNNLKTLIIAEVLYSCSPAIIHRRAVLYAPEASAWLVGDWVFPHDLKARIHLSFQFGIKAVGIESPFSGILLQGENGKSFWIYSLGADVPEISPSWVSSAYGSKCESLQSEFHFAGNPIHLWMLLPEKQGFELESRIQTLLKIWEQSGVSSDLVKM